MFWNIFALMISKEEKKIYISIHILLNANGFQCKNK